jgi:hypothetical protein
VEFLTNILTGKPKIWIIACEIWGFHICGSLMCSFRIIHCVIRQFVCNVSNASSTFIFKNIEV